MNRGDGDRGVVRVSAWGRREGHVTYLLRLVKPVEVSTTMGELCIGYTWIVRAAIA
jgi:hypothetical protein